ncbi:MAG: ABC transporter ATP-binding protein [Actinobacteria bacterium]|nr:ABC transporter ATP-binding protein [Actinomycetota bacterium]
MTNALSIRGLTKRYDADRGGLRWPLRRGQPAAGGDEVGGLLAVQDFDLEIEAGSFFGLLGPNGAGKTTIISAVCNLIRVTSGEIDIFGEPHDTLAARRMIGLAEQDVNLDRFLDVEETLLYHGGYFGMKRAEARRRAGEMMDVFDLRSKADVRAPRLSGGMRRRLLLARALMHEPRLVILDEPTAGVDFELRLELWRYIRRLHDQGTTILLTTHYLEEADELCEEIALIRDGQLIARDSAAGLRSFYAADSLAGAYVRAMGAAPASN